MARPAPTLGTLSPQAAGDALLLRLVGLFAGMALVLAAIGLWAVPELEGPGMVLRFVLSLAFFLLGAMLVAPRTRPAPPMRAPLEVELDAALREVRIVEHSRDGRAQVSARHGFDQIGRMDVQAQAFVARDTKGRILAHVPLPSSSARARLRETLRSL